MMGDRKVRYILREYQVSFFYMFSVRVSDVWDEDDLLLVYVMGIVQILTKFIYHHYKR